MAGLADGDLYERDFYAWTQDQARRLRALGRDNRFDVAHVAEEIEDLGKRERRELESHLHQALRHLIKLALGSVLGSDAADPRPGWLREVRDHRRAAQRTLRDSPGLRQAVDLAAIWAAARADANADFVDYGETPFPETTSCPVTLDDLTQQASDSGEAVAAVARAADSDTGGPAM